MVKELTKENFEKEVISSEIPVIIDFYADWCGPCQMMKPVFEEVSKEFEGKVKFMKLDTQAQPEIAGTFQIHGIPAFSLVKGNKEFARFTGYMDENAFKFQINESLKKI